MDQEETLECIGAEFLGKGTYTYLFKSCL